ncbi:MAG: SUMF1/EgtB/PvdO family nonheme iron enzyme [Janthinobacterium lividum]
MTTHKGSELPPQWELEWRVVAITAEQCDLDPATISPESRLLEDLGIDSLEVVELIMTLEEKFGVTIPDDAAGAIFTKSPVTLRAVASLVRERWGTGTPARKNWRRERPPVAFADEVPFTQRGGRMRPGEWTDGPLYEALSPNRERQAQYLRQTDGMRCVLIPAAGTWIGNDASGVADQKPAHRACLSAFLMDAEPVSNTAFSGFLNSVGDVPKSTLDLWCGVGTDDKRRHQFPLRQTRRGWEPLPGTDRQPMILVSWYGANAYSLWAHRRNWRFYLGNGILPDDLKDSADQEISAMSVRAPLADSGYSHLPSEAQWEYAARGGERPPVPSADSEAQGITAQVAQHKAGALYQADTMPAASVSSRLGMSPFGLHHMAGNVWQWCRDWYAPNFYERPDALLFDPQNAVPTGIRSERGGSWVGPPELAKPWYRRGRPPKARGRCLGFRCAGVPDGRSAL